MVLKRHAPQADVDIMTDEQGNSKEAEARIHLMSPSNAPDGTMGRMPACSRAGATAFVFLLLLSFALASSILMAAAPAATAFLPVRSYPVLVNVVDADGHPVPDVLVMASLPIGDFNKEISNLTNHAQEGFTDAAGRWRTTLRLAENETTPPSATLRAYAPYWSAAAPPQTLPNPDDEISYTFQIDLSLATYRVRAIDYQGGPMPGIAVRLNKPYFVLLQTDSDGLVSFRLPPNSGVAGQVEIGGNYEPFVFNGSVAGATQGLQVPIPLRQPLPFQVPQEFNWSVQILEASGTPLDSQPIQIESGSSRWTYLSDNAGFIHLRELPYDRVNLSWVIYNYTYRQEVRLDRAPAVIRTQQLLTMAADSPEPLGDSCYRVSVNVSDPRHHPLLKVGARPLSGAGQILFTLDREVELGQVLQFTRVICVQADTTFEVTASNPFERAVLEVQLKVTDLPPPTANVYARPPPTVVTQAGAASADRRKAELLLILVYVLIVLALIFLLMRFRTLVLYYFQSIVRFVYTSYRHKPELDDQGELKKPPVKSR